MHMTDAPSHSPSVFLAHSSQDKPFARRLASSLSSMGIRVWIDEAEIRVGESLLPKIGTAIDHCDFLIGLMSTKSVVAPWVQRELEIASTLQLKGKPISVLPVLIDDCEMPTYLVPLHYCDFRQRRKFDQSFEKLLTSILPFDIREALCEVVRQAAASEFAAYKALPIIQPTNLEAAFSASGSALARIKHLLERHAERGWVISNQLNPSTFEVLHVKVKKISARRAELESEEYWYLRWYDAINGKYEYVLNEKIRPSHVLILDLEGNWRVDVQDYTTSTCYVG